MQKLNSIDGLEVFVLMDNISDPFTTSETGVYWNESEYRFDTRQQKDLCGSDYCRACLGLSLLLRLHRKGKIHTILFDTGPDADLVVDNAKRLGLSLNEVEALVLSHGHFDHYGGTLSVLRAIGKKDLPVYTHPELFLPRAFGTNNKLVHVSYNLTVQDVEKHGGKVIESKDAISLFDNALLISGEIPRVTSYETGCLDEHRLSSKGWEKSPEVIDERCLIIEVAGHGLGVITGCGHTGVINATQYAQKLTGNDEIHFIMGGFHLADKTIADRIDPTLADLQRFDPQYLITGHCTGRRTQDSLRVAFNERHIPYGVGAYLKFGSVN